MNRLYFCPRGHLLAGPLNKPYLEDSELPVMAALCDQMRTSDVFPGLLEIPNPRTVAPAFDDPMLSSNFHLPFFPALLISILLKGAFIISDGHMHSRTRQEYHHPTMLRGKEDRWWC